MHVCMVPTYYNDGISTNSFFFFETMMAVSFTKPFLSSLKIFNGLTHYTKLREQRDCPW